MIKLKDLLPELKASSFKTGAAHETKTIKNVHHGRIPIYPALMKKVIGDVPINAFHNTDWFKAKSLKNVIGKKKSLSAYTSLTKNSNLSMGGGVQTEGGLIVQLEGKLLAASFEDIGSIPDESGRRWFHPLTFNEIVGWKYDEKDLHEFVKKNIKGWTALWSQYVNNYREKGGPSFIVDDYPPLTNKQKQQYIKGWVDGSAKFLMKHKNLIKKKFANVVNNPQVKSKTYGWNELVVYDIKIKDAFIVLDTLAPPGDVDRLEKNLKDTQKILKPLVKGKIHQGFSNAAKKFIKQRGGKV